METKNDIEAVTSNIKNGEISEVQPKITNTETCINIEREIENNDTENSFDDKDSKLNTTIVLMSREVLKTTSVRNDNRHHLLSEVIVNSSKVQKGNEGSGGKGSFGGEQKGTQILIL